MAGGAAPASPTHATEPLLALLQKALGHELPNHLVAVQGMARLLDLDSGERLSADGKDYLTRLTAAAQRAHEMVRSLADFIRALRAAGVVSRLSLGDVVREVAAELGALYPSRNIEWDLPEHGPYLSLPPVVLRHIVMHLMRYVLQSDARTGVAPIQVATREANGHIELCIADSAWQLTAEDRQGLADPFACRNSGGAATSLGMVFAHQLAENCGGKIILEPSGENGTVLLVRFPKNDK
jgi:K+-sensing histidine kinase KdpD